MIENTLIVIPARGGSKGIPGKNIKPLNGKPLIYYAIDTARKLYPDEHIYVSTDDDATIEVVENYGLQIPFKRPQEFAQDYSPNHDVLRHAVNAYRDRGINYSTVIMLQPTSPFRMAKHLKEASLLFSKDIDMLVSVTSAHENPYYTLFEETEQGYLQLSKPSSFVARQECPPVYAYNGAIYIINVNSLMQSPLRDFKKIRKYEMDNLVSVDIDTPLDWKWCEFLLTEHVIQIHNTIQ